ncbi:MAG: YjjG family noncanonical pyrimidine nucleotidase [Clostridiales bacterium]|nr:YjjG family noncanonical pyrimidine nucleotidase [Clostridiales bacterium]
MEIRKDKTDRKETCQERHFTTLLMDMDGTIFDFDEAERQGVRRVLQLNGIEPTDELIEQYHQVNRWYWQAFERGDITREQIFEGRYPTFFWQLGIEINAGETEKTYRDSLDACAALVEGAEDLCAYLYERYDIYIITNGISGTQHARMQASGLGRYFKDIFVSEDMGSQKPQTEFFEACFPRIREKDRTRMLIIGDSLTSDIRGGENTGIATCWVNLVGEPAREDIVPDYEVHSLAELKTLL